MKYVLHSSSSSVREMCTACGGSQQGNPAAALSGCVHNNRVTIVYSLPVVERERCCCANVSQRLNEQRSAVQRRALPCRRYSARAVSGKNANISDTRTHIGETRTTYVCNGHAITLHAGTVTREINCKRTSSAAAAAAAAIAAALHIAPHPTASS